MNIADMPYLMDRRDGGYSNDYTIKVYEHIPTGSNYLIEKRNFVGSFQSMLNFATELMHRVSNMPSHAIAFNQDTGEEHQIHEDGSYTITRSRFDEGGEVEAGENKEMLENQTNNLEHHIKELKEVLKNVEDVEPWVIAKAQRCVTDLMDITHYLEGDVKAEKGETEEYSEGGEVKWQEAEYGDNALVVSENKMGVIIKPYGRKFHLKFVDGTEKTYDASELKFFKDMDDFDMGGDVKKQEWVAVYVNQEKPSERKIIQAFGDTKEEATRNARMSEGYHGIKKPFELTNIYTYSGNLPMMADGGLNSDAAYKRKMKEFGFKPFGKTKGKFKVVYKDDGIAQTEVWESMEMAMSAAKKYLRMPNVSGVKILDESDMEIEIMASGGMMAKGGWLKSHKQEDFYYYSTPDKKIKTPFWYSVHEVKDIGSKETLHWTVERGGTNDMGYLRNYARKNFESKDEALKYAKSWEKEIANKYKWSESKMADGGEVDDKMKDIAYYTKLFHKYRFDSDAAASNGEDGKSMRLLDKAEGYRDEANKLIKEYNKTNKTNFTFQDFDRDGSLRIGISSGLKVPTEYTNPVAEEGRYKYVVEVKYPYNKQSFITNFSTSEKDRDPSYQAALQVIKDAQKNDDFKEGHIMFAFYIKGLGRSYTTVFHTDKKKMAMGGKVKFADKVASVKASHLKRKKVPKAVQKDYGKTFSPAEAEDSAKRIVGAMTAKERLQARLKKRKK